MPIWHTNPPLILGTQFELVQNQSYNYLPLTPPEGIVCKIWIWVLQFPLVLLLLLTTYTPCGIRHITLGRPLPT